MDAPKFSESHCDALVGNARADFLLKNYTTSIGKYKDIISYKTSSIKNGADYGQDLYKDYANISCVYHHNRNFKEALEAGQKCAELKPEWYKAYYRCAKACEGLLDAENAKKYYDLMYASAESSQIDEKAMNDYHNKDINILREWLLANGAEFGDIATEYYDVDYRGVTVVKPIKDNTVIIKVPSKCVISLEESKANPINKALVEHGMNYNSPHTYIAIELLLIKSDPTHFKYPYIRCLPKFFSNVPINFKEDELKQLEGSFALIKIQQKLQYLKLEYDNIVAFMKKAGSEFPFSYDDFVWARTAIITRVYAVERVINGESVKDTVLTPFADMANHVIPANTHWYFDKQTDCFTVKSTQYLQMGDKLYESYGQKCNYRYFVNYGFTVENNPFEEVCLVTNPILYAVISSKLYQTDEKYLNYINTSQDIFQVGYDITAEPFQTMIKTCRDKCQALMPSDKKQAEINAFYMVIEFSKRTLNGFETTLEDDRKLLKIMDHGFNERNCIIQRIGEKTLLAFYVQYFGDLIKVLSAAKDIRKKLLKKLKRGLDPHMKGFYEFAKKLSDEF
jgi:histone-lysine N-methyltransferase SETD3